MTLASDSKEEKLRLHDSHAGNLKESKENLRGANSPFFKC